MTNEAANQLDVSVDTIRRDLRTLHDKGLLRRVHGGAVPAGRLPESFTGRTDHDGATPSRLAAEVVDRFRPGQVIGLDAGSTSVEIAALIPPTMAVTVVTNNPAAAVVLADHPGVTVMLLGGTVDLTWMAVVGPDAVDGWRNYHLDLGVVGVCGFDPDTGATTNSPSEVGTKRALIEASAEVVIPVRSEKLGTVAPFVVAESSAADTLVVEAGTDDDLLDRCRAASIEVVSAG